MWTKENFENCIKQAKEKLKQIDEHAIFGNEKNTKQSKENVICLILLNQEFAQYVTNLQGAEFWINFYSNVGRTRQPNTNSQIITNFYRDKKNVIEHLGLLEYFKDIA